MMANFATKIAPFLAVSGQTLSSIDENQSGADDLAGALLTYVADVIVAVDADEELPELPEIITKGTNEKLTKSARVSLQIVAPILVLAQFQVKDGNLKKVFRYASQIVNQLLAGKSVNKETVSLKRK